MDGDEEPPLLSPSPHLSFSSSSSSLLKDISNYKTPKRPSQVPNFHSPSCHQFFTASKQTPCPPSSFRRPRPSLAPPSTRRPKSTARRLKAFELEQSKSSRKAQIQKQNSLKSLAKSLSVWLNFLFENPRSCGCGNGDAEEVVSGKGKRDSGSGVGIGVDAAATWQRPKRRRDLLWRKEVDDAAEFPSSMFASLRSSLKDVCSFDDLKERMRSYLSLGCCKDIFKAMTHVTKTIDEGRLKMKAHCPLVTDFGLKEKATRTLMSYNPIWLRIGLYIIFGGDSLLSNVNVNSDQEITFLKMVIEKQFFSHAGLAKAYAYNKMVEGLYRPGYYENLGNVILKRFLLLVLILDRAKCQSSIPLKYGIDGVDGGSPLLFTTQSGIKSSCQVIQDFLSSDIMHGEGNILAHLVIVGHKVSYQQVLLLRLILCIMVIFICIYIGILHTCATLDMATEHSQRCCEELVAAGAINTLLKLIRSVSRSIPDQEVLKHALSTLRNLARYPHLIEVLIDSHGSVEVILWEFLRSKEDGYFIASELLKKICSTHKGVEAIHKLPTHLKRLQSLVEELTRKANNEKRNARGPAARNNIERRLREAVEVLKVIANGQV
ncbi:uncharacterized protein LOC115991101 [Quercus lobata]|uniref:uncharacterized protein LOC115991101 n=1 Tax=Quercus lobata TaxID=97700 RepID=UPI001244CFBE|nr:uncharacterized protein LOC115991101 [Quercus lobata]